MNLPSDVQELGVEKSSVDNIREEVVGLVWVFESTTVLM